MDPGGDADLDPSLAAGAGEFQGSDGASESLFEADLALTLHVVPAARGGRRGPARLACAAPVPP